VLVCGTDAFIPVPYLIREKIENFLGGLGHPSSSHKGDFPTTLDLSGFSDLPEKPA